MIKWGIAGAILGAIVAILSGADIINGTILGAILLLFIRMVGIWIFLWF